MQLKELLKNTDAAQALSIHGNADIDITGIKTDSRQIKKNDLFIAVKGTQTDGHDYIPQAIDKGATVIAYQKGYDIDFKDGVTYICLENTEEATGQLATTFYGDPTSKMQLVGVTGTNGKTTIATLLYQIFMKAGYKTGLISTVCNYINGKSIPTEHTTPDPITLNALLAQMAEEGCQYAFMEVSSHSVAQHRIAGLKFAGGIFTNLTRDHLDYHKTFENYLKAKKAFFDNLPAYAFAITNADDKNGNVMLQNTVAKKYTYSIRGNADFKARILECHFEGMLLEINRKEVTVRFTGKFNASNLIAVYGAACLLGLTEDDVLLILSTLVPVAGRFNALRSKRGYTTIVDYAHTPDALINVLNAIHEVLDKKGKVITVIGAGGNRDKGKRPLMAHAAAQLSDKIIITSDNPRFEDPQDIINDMLEGLNEEDRKKTLCNPDRREAIKTACMIAEKNDVVLIAGKGHENYQEIKGVKHHFDDKEEIEHIFENE